MVVFSSMKVENSLKKKGFCQENGKKKHRIYRVYDANGGRVGVKTMVSHNKQEISGNLIDFMAREVRLSKEQFINLINCPLSKEEYYEILKEKGLYF